MRWLVSRGCSETDKGLARIVPSFKCGGTAVQSWRCRIRLVRQDSAVYDGADQRLSTSDGFPCPQPIGVQVMSMTPSHHRHVKIYRYRLLCPRPRLGLLVGIAMAADGHLETIDFLTSAPAPPIERSGPFERHLHVIDLSAMSGALAPMQKTYSPSANSPT